MSVRPVLSDAPPNGRVHYARGAGQSDGSARTMNLAVKPVLNSVGAYKPGAQLVLLSRASIDRALR
jgi:hypothetical protein